MRHLQVIFIALTATLTTAALQGQTVEEALASGNRQYVLFESERDRGNIDAAYNYLADSYVNFKKVVETAPDGQQRNAAKARLKNAYPFFEKATLHYGELNNSSKALQFAVSYVEIPKLAVFRGDLLPKSTQYAAIVYYAGVSAYKLSKLDAAALMFREYLDTEAKEYVQDAYLYLNMIYQAQKNYSEQENILEKAHAQFPLKLDFLYNLVNVHIATKNMDKLMATINEILKVDPNDQKVLPIKARLLESAGKTDEALQIYQRLYTLAPENFELLTGLARANFNKATEIINAGAAISDDLEYAKIKQRAAGYLADAQELFLKILEKQPTNKQYMLGLAGVYQYLNMTPEYATLNKIISDEKGSFAQFPALLTVYREKLEAAKITTAANARSDTANAPTPLSPARLAIRIDEFTDGNSNRVIDAGENFTLTFTITNEGQGDAFNTRIRLSEQNGLDTWFDGAKEIDGGNISAGKSRQFTMRYIVDKNLPSGTAAINIYAFEANGFDAAPAELLVSTMDLAIPRLTVADHQFIAPQGTSITKGNNGKLTVAVLNEGSVAANKVRVSFTLPGNVFKTADTDFTVDSIAPGEVKLLECNFVVNNRFDKDSIAILMAVSEASKNSTIHDSYKVKVGQYLTTANTLKIEGLAAERRTVARNNFSLSFKSELLESVPDGLSNPHRYALVIGNEDYSRAGANAEINVPYAVNDAVVFREYCLRTFGIPASQVKLVQNATAGIMHEQLDWLVNMASADPSAELFFFFSGHGNNDEKTKDAFLVPVDVSGRNIRFGISIAELYRELGKYPMKGAYVFLDACFSGGFKGDAALTAAKSVRVVPKTGIPQGNTLCISSSSGDQTSNVYHEKKQGYFTYYLLKTLQESQGNISLKELYDKTEEAVKKATTLTGKPQAPQLLVSPTLQGWETLQLLTR
ncbi:MAG: caspase family protein [Bacteroidales bacterium]|jgi:hypothetical protein|nr:caspase family protein [Bacteroidales bacterium]